MFRVNGEEFEEMTDATQEAEFLTSETGREYSVRALHDDPHGLFQAGDIVYTSQGLID
jgi:hypothetical protein